MSSFRGYSKLQLWTATILVASFGTGLAARWWLSLQPLPPVDPEVERWFLAISDSLNASDREQHDRALTIVDQAADAWTINVNEATAAQLQRLPGIGPVMAQRIVAYRDMHGRFVRVEDLIKVRGIGPKTLAKMKKYIVL